VVILTVQFYSEMILKNNIKKKIRKNIKFQIKFNDLEYLMLISLKRIYYIFSPEEDLSIDARRNIFINIILFNFFDK